MFLIISAIVLGLFIGLLDSVPMQREQEIETVAVSKFAGNQCIREPSQITFALRGR